jgi:uncharacterized membrane protein YcaP (DUF421 family)
MGQLREQGLETADDVKRCYLEGDGHVSIIKMESQNSNETTISPAPRRDMSG